MSLFLSVLAIITLSAGILWPRLISQKLQVAILPSVKNVTASIRKLYFLSIAPLLVMSFLIYQGYDDSILLQLPAASILIDVYCSIKVRNSIKQQEHSSALGFLLIPFVTLGISKLLLFAAFLIEMNDHALRQNAFSF